MQDTRETLGEYPEIVERILERLSNHTGGAIAWISESQTLYEATVEWAYQAHRGQHENRLCPTAPNKCNNNSWQK